MHYNIICYDMQNEVPYYPEETGESIDTNLYTITNSSTKKEDSIVVRALDISRPELEVLQVNELVECAARVNSCGRAGFVI